MRKHLVNCVLAGAVILLGGASMAQEGEAELTEEAKALLEQIDLAKKRKELAAAELERLNAEKALQDALNPPTKTPEEVAAENLETQKKAAEAQKALADAESAVMAQRKAAADAQKAALEAEQTAVAAKLGTVEGSDLQGIVTLKSGAGTGEAALLAANAIDEAIEKIAAEIGPRPGAGKRYIIFAGDQRPEFGSWRALRVEQNIVALAFTRASNLERQARNGASQVGVDEEADHEYATEAVGAAVTAIGAALDVATKLGSYFKSDYEVGSIQITGVDDDLLAVALAAKLEGASYPARSARPFGDDDPITTILGDLIQKRSESVTAVLQLKEIKSRIEAGVGSEEDAQKKRRMEAAASNLATAIAAHEAAQKGFDDLVARLSTADATGATFASRVIAEKFVADSLRDGDYALFVRVNSTPGSYYTKKNLWTFFGGMPYRVMGGVIVSYMAVNGENDEIGKSGQVAVHGGYKKVSEVEGLVQGRLASP